MPSFFFGDLVDCAAVCWWKMQNKKVADILPLDLLQDIQDIQNIQDNHLQDKQRKLLKDYSL